MFLLLLELAWTQQPTVDLLLVILRTRDLRPTSVLTETLPTPTDIVTGTAEIGGTEAGTMNVAEIMIETEDVAVAEVEIGDVAEVGIEEIETDTEIIETIEIAETEMIIEETEMIEEIETEKDTETVAETDIETGDNLPFWRQDFKFG